MLFIGKGLKKNLLNCLDMWKNENEIIKNCESCGGEKYKYNDYYSNDSINNNNSNIKNNNNFNRKIVCFLHLSLFPPFPSLNNRK